MYDDDNYQPGWLTEEYLLDGGAPDDNLLEWMDGTRDHYYPCGSWAGGHHCSHRDLMSLSYEDEYDL